jgi:hypothetical protein
MVDDNRGQMCRYVGIVVYQDLIQDVSTFESESDANAWVAVMRGVYGWEETSGSLTWDTARQFPIYIQGVEDL